MTIIIFNNENARANPFAQRNTTTPKAKAQVGRMSALYAADWPVGKVWFPALIGP